MQQSMVSIEFPFIKLLKKFDLMIRDVKGFRSDFIEFRF